MELFLLWKWRSVSKIYSNILLNSFPIVFMGSIYASISAFIQQSHLYCHIMGEIIKYQCEIFYTTLASLYDAFKNHQIFNEATKLSLNTYDYIFFFILKFNLTCDFIFYAYLCNILSKSQLQSKIQILCLWLESYVLIYERLSWKVNESRTSSWLPKCHLLMLAYLWW